MYGDLCVFIAENILFRFMCFIKSKITISMDGFEPRFMGFKVQILIKTVISRLGNMN